MDLIGSAYSRRMMLAGGFMGLTAACVRIPGPGLLQAQRAGFFEKHQLPIGIQLYSLGPDINKNLDACLSAVAAIGYRSVELPGLLGRTGHELRTSLDAAGLICSSIHVQGQGQLDRDLGGIVREITAIGARTAVTPRPYFPERFGTGPASGQSSVDWFRQALSQMTADDWKRNADFLNEKGRGLADQGVKVGYHNHNGEFAPLGATTGLEILLENTDPAFVTFELDIGWALAAGADPDLLLRHHRNRFSLVHIKEVRSAIESNYTLNMSPVELGLGKTDWTSLLATAFDCGVRQFFVEQEPPFDHPRIESAAINYRYLSTLPA